MNFLPSFNNKDHPKNFGFLGLKPDRWDLAPLYNMVPGITLDRNHFLSMEVGKKGKEASIENALSRHERFRLSKDQANQIVFRLQQCLSGWDDHFREYGVRVME